MKRIFSELVKRVRIGFVGVGMPGPGLPKRLRKIAEGVSPRMSRVRAACAALVCAITAVTFAAGVLARAQSAAPASPFRAVTAHFSSQVPAVSAVQESAAPVQTAPTEYVGSRVSFSVKGVYLEDFLRVFGPECGYNVDIDPTVTGVLTFSATNTPCDETLYRILVKNGLSARVDGDVLEILATGNPGITLPKPRPHPANPVGGIAGTVKDPTGGVLPGAVVELTSSNSASRFLFQMQTDAQGAFALDILPPGPYELSASQGTFQRYDTTISIAAGRVASLDIPLSLPFVVRREPIAAQQSVNAASTGSIPPLPVCSPTNIVFRVPGDVASEARETIGTFSIPRAVYAPRPPYTESALAAGIQGSVIVRALIGKDGTAKPECLNANSEVTDPGLVQSAVRTLSTWRFSPATANGVPIDMEEEVEVVFEHLN